MVIMNNNSVIWDFNICSSNIVIVQFRICLRTFILYVDTEYITDQIENVHYDILYTKKLEMIEKLHFVFTIRMIITFNSSLTS